MDVIVLAIAVVTVIIMLAVAGFLLIRWRRHQYRFSMRALMLTVAVVAGGLTVVLQFILPKFEHRWAVHQIYISGGRVNFPDDSEREEHDYDPRRLLRNYWRGVSSINVGGDQEAIAVAKLLESIPELQMVRFYGVTDAGLEAICQMGPYPSLVALDFDDSRITGAGLSDTSSLQNVRSLFFNTCQVDASAMARFKSMPALRGLWLIEEGKSANPARYPEESFAEIGSLDNLELLHLTNLQITDAAARHLSGLKRLKILRLSHCKISDSALQELRRTLPSCQLTRNLDGSGLSETSEFRDVRGLVLRTSPEDEAALARLTAMPDLRDLSIYTNKSNPAKPAHVNEEGFAEIGRVESLEYLDLRGLQISDAAAQSLHDLKRLKKLTLVSCRISNSAAEELRAALPDCDVKIFPIEERQ
jgi:Leucine Rich repeat